MFLSSLKYKKVWIAVFVVIVVYLLSLVIFYQFNRYLIFQATALSKDYSFQFEQPYEEYFVSMANDDSLNVLLFKTTAPSKGLIFYAHGNADNLQRWGKFASDFTDLGYDVVMYDYRGYGKSSGTSNDKNIHQDAATLLNWTKVNIPHTKLVIYGRSLGSTVASTLAVHTTPDLLILETPFAEFKDVIYWPLLPAYYLFPLEANLNNTNSLATVACKKIIFHGTQDWVVPLSSALKLKPLLDTENDFIIIEGAGHKNLSEFEAYHLQLAQVLK